MKKETQKLIYTDDIWKSWKNEKAMKEDYAECHELSEEEMKEIDDYTIYEWCHETLNMYWDDLRINIGGYGEYKQYLLIADLGLWNGRFPGGKILKGLFNAIQATVQDSIKIYEEGRGVLKIKSSHHDGTNYYTIYELTEKGEQFIENNPYMDNRELHEKLLNNRNYRRNVNLIKNIY